MRTTVATATSAFLLGCVVGGLGLSSLGAQPQRIKREMLRRVDIPELPGWQIALGRATIAPGVTAGRHRHAGHEVGVVLEGTARFELEGQDARTLRAGEVYHAPAGAAHDATNVGDSPATALACWVVPKDKPFATPVK